MKTETQPEVFWNIGMHVLQNHRCVDTLKSQQKQFKAMLKTCFSYICHGFEIDFYTQVSDGVCDRELL